MSETPQPAGTLTPEDIREAIEFAYSPRQAALVFHNGKPGPSHRRNMRPAEGGENYTAPGGTRRERDNSAKGMTIRLAGHTDGQPWERTGLITWTAAERLIRDCATPDAVDALKGAVAHGMDRAATKAWQAIIRPAEAPEVAAEPAAATTVPSGRRAPSPLRPLVAAHLAAHPGEEFTVRQVAKALDRSHGATANALATLAGLGEAERTCESPLRYRAAGPDA